MANALTVMIGGLLVLGVLLAGAVSFFWENGHRSMLLEPWPETAFIYEYDEGLAGDRKLITRYRLTYYGRNDWLEEVLPSDSVVLPHGSFPLTRSTRRMEERVYTEHDLDTGITKTEVIGENTTFSPSGWFIPFPFALHEANWGGSPRLVETDATVCFRARDIPGQMAGMDCRNNAPAWRFDSRDVHHMFLDDRRGIPMGGSSFKMIEVRVYDHQEPVEWSLTREALLVREDWRRSAALWWLFVLF